jgi:hypothetical protein
MNLLTHLKKHCLDFDWWKNTAFPYVSSHLYRSLLNRYAYVYYSLNGVEFISIPDSDWDNLILFDACRYDYFVEQNIFNAEPERKYSSAPQTPIFLQKNFKNRELHDTVIISANPHQEIQLDDDQFHKIYHVWQTHWDDELKTVHPRNVTEVAKQANRKHPQKRLIIHYMQPHTPFIGSWARENIGIYLGTTHAYKLAQDGFHDCDTKNPYSMLKNGEISREAIIQAYKENLDLVMKYAEDLLDELQGKTVVSADHGEMFGEWAWPIPRKAYQHPPIMAKTLLEVPWLVMVDGTRKTISSESPVQQENLRDEEVVERRLKHLGYK